MFLVYWVPVFNAVHEHNLRVVRHILNNCQYLILSMSFLIRSSSTIMIYLMISSNRSVSVRLCLNLKTYRCVLHNVIGLYKNWFFFFFFLHDFLHLFWYRFLLCYVSILTWEGIQTKTCSWLQIKAVLSCQCIEFFCFFFKFIFRLAPILEVSYVQWT